MMISRLTAISLLGTGVLALAQLNIIYINVNDETPGGEPSAFLGIVGHWVVESAYRNVLVEDGKTWKQGETGANLANKAKTLFGEGNAAFLKTVMAKPAFPFAVARPVEDFKNGVVWTRFQLVDGTQDRAAGILFNLKPNGDYMVLEYNAIKGRKDESRHLTLWSFHAGEGKLLETSSGGRDLTQDEWSFMQITVTSKTVTGLLGTDISVTHPLDEPVSGRVGVWSKSDSVVMFDDYRVVPK